MKKFNLPEHTKSLPDSTNMLTKDLYTVFGYKLKNSFINQIHNSNIIPKPDGRIKVGVDYKNYVYFWTLGSLRKIEKDQSNG